jgi:molybdenum cofactor synthesis domain-containing protein
MIRVAVLTVSDRASRGEREDLSGPAVARRAAEVGWRIVWQGVVADDAALISARLSELAASGACDLILTTGGTGIAARDVTPEATRAVLEKELPGLGELMRTEGLRHTPRAVLSRATAGTLGGALIVNLPGSPRGAIQSLDAISHLVQHIRDLLAGETEHESGAKLERGA